MNKLYAVAAVVLALRPALAFAGEGNGPEFPGLQIPVIDVTSSTAPGGVGTVTLRMSHRSDEYSMPRSGYPTGVNPSSYVYTNSQSGATQGLYAAR